MNWLVVFYFVSNWIFIFALAYYLQTNLQWYNYSFYRVITKHHKQIWHFLYFLLPLALFIAVGPSNSPTLLFISLYLFYLPLLINWAIGLDKKLVFTRRIKTFFIILFAFMALQQYVLVFFLQSNNNIFFLLSLIFSLICSYCFEAILFNRYKKQAQKKLNFIKDLKIIAITASYGKTSIKNFLYQILRTQYQVYATPRSVNTIKGIVSDINENLPPHTEIYIVEAGARQKGDIAEIAHLLNHQYGIIGEVGEQHLEYFKKLENIMQTKFELLESNRLEFALIFKDNTFPQYLSKNKKIQYFPTELRNEQANLEETSFELEIEQNFYTFKTNILGAFNIHNLSAAILLGHHLKIPIPTMQRVLGTLQPIPHRLTKEVVNGKMILDSSFNGNLNGMLESVRIAGLYDGRKVIITPGIIESDEKSNITLAKAIDSTFDMAIITGELNSHILSQHIRRPQKIVLKDKSQLQNFLLNSTYKGDLILFANDAPNFI
ncbi:UDP-N-acetylmuramoylalanyl-D-glutamyl-2, 6-diaminopimelate--ligase [Helicobacter mustelae]|uniref:Mur ligase family protein n=1 Tax=Helicobacter mustelae TaxID=217 RepID=UPI000E02244A|nr:UDP-N-acetylmuramoyl-tripeptide--D-alanyl-D-alanine ligase [Helicobacter mustelae]STP12354.1 UDP-N-acetylmuramoylalanyl-D-glutamyl-2, 6-diaminopimelate--ligase [Helicobacter mustelae]